MANQTLFLTTAVHAKIEADAADDDSANRHNVLDQRLDTFWQPDLSTNKAIRFDLNTTTGINITHFAIWVANYDSLVGDVDITVTESDTDGSRYSTIGTPTNITFGIGGLFLVELDTAGSKRYLRITFASTAPSSPYPEIAGIYFLTNRQITARPEFPMGSPPKHFNKIYKAGGGQQYVTAESLNYIRQFSRNFTVITSADNTTLENVFIDTAGRRRLFIYHPGTVSEAYLCRMDVDKPDIQFIEYDFYQAKLRFSQVPFIVDGEVM